MSENGASVQPVGDVAETVGLISGSNRPESAGHRFGPELICIECGKTWEDHQVEPTVCTPPVEFSAQYRSLAGD